MKHRIFRSSWIVYGLSLALVLPQGVIVRAQAPAPTAAPAAVEPPVGTNADPGWPRVIALPSGTAIWHQPQVESWIGQKNMVAWSAVAYTPTGASAPAMGSIKIEAPTSVSVDERVVRLDLQITVYNFTTLSPAQVRTLVAEVQARPNNERVLDLDRVLSFVTDSTLQVKSTEGIKADPPKIFWAPAPAMLMNLDGEVVWSTIENIDLRYAVNTNWDLFEHTPTKALYLRYNEGWMTATAVMGPWAPVTAKLPDSFTKLPANENWKDVKAAVPGKKLSGKAIPKVFVSQEPAELIELQGDPSYVRVDGTQTLVWVSNTEADLFRMGPTGDFYFLVAGRWFKSATLDGPWTFATTSLPPDFKLIPQEHTRSRVLASVPGTREATEAVLLASIPRTARVNKRELKAPDVAYQGGTPEFKPITGTTGVEQAVNTDKDIVKYGDVYYLCYQGVWFTSAAAAGPWEVASSIPQAIYSIPASSPVHHVTYVTVEDDDNSDEWVTFAYVAAYTGMMIGYGCVMWGSGWYYPPYYGYGGYYPYPHTYGMGAWYNPHTGVYGRGYGAYGPYGGVGMGAAYNPRTGTYARGATAYGPYGSRSAAQAYNPRTGTYAQTRQGSNVYGNWGTSSVQRGDNWAQTAHRENYRTGNTTSGIRTSEGGGAISRNGTAVGRTGDGDMYAGRDGNVYRNTGGGWEQVRSGAEPKAGDNATGTARDTARSPQTSQLDRDRAARTSGNQRVDTRSTYERSGSPRSTGGSYAGSRARAGGGGGGGGRRR